MSAESQIMELIRSGLLPGDTEIISTHNNLVASSQKEKIVARIGQISLIAQREDPGDVDYSHRISRIAADNSAPVVRPLTEKPIAHGDMIISLFPMRHNVNWAEQRAHDIYLMTQRFNNAFESVDSHIELRELDVVKYAQARLDYARTDYKSIEQVHDFVQEYLDAQQTVYPFNQLVEDDPSLTHGDLHAWNVLSDDSGRLEIIDLDSTARGPRLYDLASWRVRHNMGDIAPMEDVIEVARRDSEWNEEAYRALIGWKVLSSMTHVLRYEKKPKVTDRVQSLAGCAQQLGVPIIYKEIK